jgi:DNA-binding NarL/FixJ family response regulator
MTEREIKVLLVDDHIVVRNGVRLMLSAEPDIVVVAEAGNAQDALALVRSEEVDVALVDIAMPGKNGLELLKQLRAEKPRLAVLILSTYSESVYAVRALKAGAAGYLTKDSPTAVLVEAVRKAASGGKYVSPTLMEQLADVIAGDGVRSHDMLSTVTTYRTRVLEKMGRSNNAELTRYAMENGLLL